MRNDGSIEREQAQLAYQQQASDRNELERILRENAQLKTQIRKLETVLASYPDYDIDSTAAQMPGRRVERSEFPFGEFDNGYQYKRNLDAEALQ